MSWFINAIIEAERELILCYQYKLKLKYIFPIFVPIRWYCSSDSEVGKEFTFYSNPLFIENHIPETLPKGSRFLPSLRKRFQFGNTETWGIRDTPLKNVEERNRLCQKTQSLDGYEPLNDNLFLLVKIAYKSRAQIAPTVAVL